MVLALSLYNPISPLLVYYKVGKGLFFIRNIGKTLSKKVEKNGFTIYYTD